jgi:hypothetical protein
MIRYTRIVGMIIKCHCQFALGDGGHPGVARIAFLHR